MNAALACESARGTLIDEALGEADAAAIDAARAHVENCRACHLEADALRETIALLQRRTVLLPSPNFRAGVDAALDAVDSAEERRVDRVRLWRRRVAAALLPLAVGAGWLLHDRFSSASPSNEVAEEPLQPISIRVDERSNPGSGVVNGRPSATPRRPSGSEVATAPPELVRPPEVLEPHDPPEFPRLPGNDPDHAGAHRSGDLVQLDPIDRKVGGTEPRGGLDALPTSETPVERALDWLVKNQSENGQWTPGLGEPGTDTAVTGLVLLALVSGGHLGSEVALARGQAPSRFDAAVDRACAWLRGRQDPRDGSFAGGRDEAAQIFCQSVATLALVEKEVGQRAALGDRLGASSAAERKQRQDQLERALSKVEISLDRLFETDARALRCAGQDAAWAALALTTARHGGIDFHLKPSSERSVDRMLAQLRTRQPELMMATSQAIDALAELPVAPQDEAWARAVDRVVENPAGVEPSLRFLVASALCGAQRGGSTHGLRDGRPEEWKKLDAALYVGLMKTRSAEHGYFDSGTLWECFGGGPVYETALAVLTLTVAERREAFAAARTALEAKGRKGH